MRKVLVDRELLENCCDAAKDAHAASLLKELEAILDKPAEAEGVSVVGVVCISHFKNNPAMENVEFHLAADLPQGQHEVILHSSHLAALSAVTAERDRLREEAELHDRIMSESCAKALAERDQLRAEVERLRNELAGKPLVC